MSKCYCAKCHYPLCQPNSAKCAVFVIAPRGSEERARRLKAVRPILSGLIELGVRKERSAVPASAVLRS